MEAQVAGIAPQVGAPDARAKASSGRWGRRLKRALIGVSAVVSALYAAEWMWIQSGSNQWELQMDERGAQIYTMKSPGSAMVKIRGVVQSKEFSLSNHLAPFLDASIQDDCAKWVEGCIRYQVIKPFDPRTQSNVTMWTVAVFPPFMPREFLLQGNLSQDPLTKVVTLENIAVPNKLPQNDCCVRLTHVHNVWRYEPMADGSIKVEFLSDLDMGGSFPKILLNLGAPGEIHKMLTVDNPKQLRQEKYRQASLYFIDKGKPGPTKPGSAP